MIHEHLHRLCRSDGNWLFAETSDKHFFFVGNFELNRANRANPSILQLPQPLMRHLKIAQNWGCVNAPDFLSPPIRRSQA
ncbi:MAG: hypothetical protein RLZZ15_395 [Verrucomicrobiota bacterium]